MTKRPTRKRGASQEAIPRLVPFAPVGQEAKQAAPEPVVQEVQEPAGRKRERKATKEIATLVERPRPHEAPSVPTVVPAFAPTPDPVPQPMEAPQADDSALESELWALEPLEAAVAGIAAHLSQIETSPGATSQADGSGLRRLGMLQGLVARLRPDAWTRTQAMLDAADVEARHNPGSQLVDPVRRRANMTRVGLEANAQAVEALLEKSSRQQKSKARQEHRTLLLAGVLVASLATLAFLLQSLSVPGGLDIVLGSLSALGCAGLLAWATRLFLRDWRQRVPPPHVPGVAAALQVLRQQGSTDVEACEVLLPVVAELADQDASEDPEAEVTAFAIRAVIGCMRPLGMPWPGAATLVRHSLDPTQRGRWLGAHEYASILRMAGLPYTYQQADAVAADLEGRPAPVLLAGLGLGPAT